MTSVARPGWYPDPDGAAGRYRWWDGASWSDVTSVDQRAPAPEPTAKTAAEPTAKTAAEPTPETAMPSGGHPGGAAGGGRPAAVRTVAVALGLVLLVSASLGIGLVVWGAPGTERAGVDRRARPQTVTSPARTGALDTGHRRAAVGSASLILPPEPYRLHDDPISVRNVFDVVFLATADVHPRYDGLRTWSAAVALVSLDPQLAEGGDLERAGETALRQLSVRFYGGHRTSLRSLTWAHRSVDGSPGMAFTAEVHYRAKGLPSSHDLVAAHAVTLDDGRTVVAISSVPDDAPVAVRRLAEQSLETLTVG